MADLERSGYYIVFTETHCVLKLQKTLITLLSEIAQGLITITENYETKLKVTNEFEFHISPNKKVNILMGQGKIYTAIRPPLVGRL